MPRSGNFAAILLLAFLLAGCSGPAPAALPGEGTTSAASGSAPAQGNRTVAPLAPTLTLGDCAGIETITPMPMQDALALLPPGYLPLPYQAFLGAPSTGQEPAATLFTLTFVCGTARGAVNGTGEQIAYVGIVVQAPANVTAAGPNVVMLDVVASDPALAKLYAAAGFRVQGGQVAFTPAGAGPAAQASATVAGGSLAFTQRSGGQAGAPQDGFFGRFFAVKDRQVGGAADFTVADGIVFSGNVGAVQAQQGSLAGQPGGAGFADAYTVSSFTLTFHGLPLPPAPEA